MGILKTVADVFARRISLDKSPIFFQKKIQLKGIFFLNYLRYVHRPVVEEIVTFCSLYRKFTYRKT